MAQDRGHAATEAHATPTSQPQTFVQSADFVAAMASAPHIDAALFFEDVNRGAVSEADDPWSRR